MGAGGDLAARLADRIRQDGPLPFPVFMEAALYGPDGFNVNPSAFNSRSTAATIWPCTFLSLASHPDCHT